MPAAGEDGISIIIEHHAVFAPQHYDRNGGQQDQRSALEALRPGFNWAKWCL